MANLNPTFSYNNHIFESMAISMATTNYADLSIKQCQSARLARDRRFDGHFYVAVKTTGIFCRPICPATTPKEENVEYFFNQAQALQAGYRPCLRCRPDSAPGSCAWQGVETTFQRAIQLIDQGRLQQSNLTDFAERLGISDRYLRKLFNTHLGMSPKQYAQYQQVIFAKQLLHSSAMDIGDIAFASGFNSVRRFNDAFVKILRLTPGAIRKTSLDKQADNRIILTYRPPFNWQHLLDFYRLRAIDGIEAVGDNFYSRSFTLGKTNGWFKASQTADNALAIEFSIDDIRTLRLLVKKIRRLFDLDADITLIENHLSKTFLKTSNANGIRIPGVWNTWEAGLRAIFGQQVSVKAAIKQLNAFVHQLGNHQSKPLFFPTPEKVASADLSFLKMPQSRKETIKRFAQFLVNNPNAHPDQWLAIKGVGPWTINYAKLRGLSDPDCFLATDLVVKKAIAGLSDFNEKSVSPWGSYATFYCWSSQS